MFWSLFVEKECVDERALETGAAGMETAEFPGCVLVGVAFVLAGVAWRGGSRRKGKKKTKAHTGRSQDLDTP